MITIPLSKPEAKLTRDAAKHAEAGLFVDAGDVVLDPPQWRLMARWLSVYACKDGLKLDTRQAAERLSVRIGAVVEHWDREHPVVVKPVKTVARDLFAGAGT